MSENLLRLAKDLEDAIQVIVALTHCARERDIAPPASVFEAADTAVETLSTWRDEIRRRSVV